MKDGQGFSKFVIYALRVIFFIIMAGSIIKLGNYFKVQKTFLGLMLIAIYILATFLLIYALKKHVDSRKILVCILIVGAILRIIWCASVKSIPVSDYNTIYVSAQSVLNGDYSSLKGYSYFARFPHLIIFILYVAGIIKVFGTATLTAMKTVNIIASVITILLIYKVAKEIFKDEKRSIIAAFIASLFPAAILYTAVYCTENIALPFYLGSLYYFVLVMNEKKKDIYLLLSGVLLLIGHLFRATAQVMIVAYILYILIYMGRKYKRKVKSIAYILISFIIPFMILGYSLIGLGITDTKLWSGKESGITSVLKGSNIETCGRWNEEDATFIDKNLQNEEYLKNECKNKIIARYTSMSPVQFVTFEVKKLVQQWWQGDFAGAFWAQLNVAPENIAIDISNNGGIWLQFVYVVIFIMIFIGAIRNREFIENKILNILYIIFCGYGLLFLILESQERYGFIISWIFVLLAVTAIKPGKQLE